jgi:hypothetical protein
VKARLWALRAVRTVSVMADKDQGPRPAPEHMTGDGRDARTPPARPEDRGGEGAHAGRIAEGADERTTRRTDRSHGTAAEAPEQIDRE